MPDFSSLLALTQFLSADDLPGILLISGLFFAFCALGTLVAFVVLSGDSVAIGAGNQLIGGTYPFDKFPLVASVSRKRAEMVFSDEIEVGFARYDDFYSIIYLKKPDELDDLTQIRGIGKAFEDYLNQIGCFTYKQLAHWSEATCRQISIDLRSHDRLFREDWLKQARQLHLEKYGEKI